MMKLFLVASAAMCMILANLASAAEIAYSSDNDSAYSAVLNQLKQDGFDIDTASKDAGIQTVAVTARHGLKETSTYVKITVLPEKKLRVAVYEMSRGKGFTAMSLWSAPKVNEDKSNAEALKLRNELHW